MNRRRFLCATTLAVSSVGQVSNLPLQAGLGPNLSPRNTPDERETCTADEPKKEKTKFQVACMTLPYSEYPLARALSGIKNAGFKYVAWGTTHKEDGKATPVIARDATPDQAKELAKKCRDGGLDPLLMFSGIYPEAKDGLEVLQARLKQASAAGIPQVLTFGHTERGNRKLWVERFKKLGPIARDLNVLLVVKQHGGETGTGEVCASITREVNDAGIKVNYDAGNVMDYLDLDPLPDIKKCADEVHSFCLKDHRRFPKKGDCAPGFGEIDHYKLLHPVAFTGRTLPLCFENIFLPVVPRPKTAEGVDELAKKAREFIDVVIAGLHA